MYLKWSVVLGNLNSFWRVDTRTRKEDTEMESGVFTGRFVKRHCEALNGNKNENQRREGSKNIQIPLQSVLRFCASSWTKREKSFHVPTEVDDIFSIRFPPQLSSKF